MILVITPGAGETWTQGGELALALVLSSAIGLERELRQKSAGLRTHALVGLGAALFVLISKYGFTDVLTPGLVVLDPSRVAAQIVTGIGFIGGGLIFVRRDAVRGLTTAAVVWLTAAIGAAAGAGLPLLAVGATAGHFLVVYGYTPLSHRLQGTNVGPTPVRFRYRHDSGALGRVLALCTSHGFTVSELSVERELAPDEGEEGTGRSRQQPSTRRPAREVEVLMILSGGKPITPLVAELSSVEGVIAITAGAGGDEDGDSP